LERCVRLSYYERVARTLPDEFGVLLPPRPVPYLKYGAQQPPRDEHQPQSPDDDLYRRAPILAQKIRNKESSQQILAWLESIQSQPPQARLDLLLHTLCEAGSKSFSHLLNILERYHILLRAVLNTPPAKAAALAVIAEFWQNSAQHVIITLDKFMTYRVLDAMSIVNWLFSPEMIKQFPRGYVWDILRNTFTKVLTRTHTIHKEYLRAQAATGATTDAGQQQSTSDTAQSSSSAAQVHKLTQVREALNICLREQEELFILTLQHFVSVLSNYLANLEDTDKEVSTSWYTSAVGHLREVWRKYYWECRPTPERISALLQTAHPQVARLIQQCEGC
jgi:nuclear cap-binding protein subunit 1